MSKTKERYPSFVSIFGNLLAKKEGGWTCHYCGIALIRYPPHSPNSASVDHMTPACNSGKSVLENMVLCCSKCNNEKGEGDYLEFYQRKTEIRALRGAKRSKRKTIKKRGKGA